MTSKGKCAICGADFNPRTREGCDMDLVKGAIAIDGISIHAPVKGATCIKNIIKS